MGETGTITWREVLAALCLLGVLFWLIMAVLLPGRERKRRAAGRNPNWKTAVAALVLGLCCGILSVPIFATHFHRIDVYTPAVAVLGTLGLIVVAPLALWMGLRARHLPGIQRVGAGVGTVCGAAAVAFFAYYVSGFVTDMVQWLLTVAKMRS